MAVWTLYCRYKPHGVCGFKGYLVHTTYIPLLWNEKSRLWPYLGRPGSHNRGRPCGRLWFHGSFNPNLYVPSILGPLVQMLFGTYSSYTRLTVESKSRIWPSLGCCRSHKQGRPCGRLWFHGSLEPVLYVPTILGLWVQWLFATRSSYTLCYGIKNHVYGQVQGAVVPTIVGVPMADYNFMAVWTPNCLYQPYWVRGSKGYLVHIAHVPALMWNQNRVNGLVWDAVVPTNEGVPQADDDLMAAWTLYFMYQPYWVCGSKSYLVHKTHITPAVEWKIAYMAKFGVPSFPQLRASLWQVRIVLQFGPKIVCTSHIGSVGPRAIWYI